MKIELSVNGILVLMLNLFTISTLTYRIWPSFLSVNRIIGIIIIIILLYDIGRYNNKNKLILVFVSFLLCFIAVLWTLYNNNDISKGIEDAIYWFTTILFLQLLNDHDFCEDVFNEFKLHYILTKRVAVIMDFYVLISLFLPQCYHSNWEGTYYIGFGFSEHAICGGLCMLGVLLLFVLNQKKNVRFWDIFYFMPVIIAILQSGARTFIVSIAIVFIAFYCFCVPQRELKVVLIPIIVIAFFPIVQRTNVVNKFISAASNQYTSSNKWVSFSNGRLEFWNIDIKAYLDYDLFSLLFGKGFDNVYRINYTQYHGSYIWAHNDVITTLLGVGLIGLILYGITITKLYTNISSLVNHKIIILLLIIYLVWEWFVNGLFALQHYLYSFGMLYIFLTCDKKFKYLKEG